MMPHIVIDPLCVLVPNCRRTPTLGRGCEGRASIDAADAEKRSCGPAIASTDVPSERKAMSGWFYHGVGARADGKTLRILGSIGTAPQLHCDK
jgi:hypothetical protein